LDFYSIGHVIFGHFVCLITFFIALYMPHKYLQIGMLQHYLLIVAIFGVGWEIVENNLLIKCKLKRKRDSLNNSLCDIVCVILGGILCGFIIYHFFNDLFLFLVITIILLMIEFFFFYLCGSITYF